MFDGARAASFLSVAGRDTLYWKKCFGVGLRTEGVGLTSKLAVVGGVTKTGQGLPQVNRFGHFWWGVTTGMQGGDGRSWRLGFFFGGHHIGHRTVRRQVGGGPIVQTAEIFSSAGISRVDKPVDGNLS